MTLFIDTSVLMYAAGAEHPLRAPCRVVMQRIGAGSLDATTSVEVVQEILHRFLGLRQPDLGRELAEATLDTFAPVLPVTHAVMRRVPALSQRYPELQARDLLHVATCIHEGITEIVSADQGFDRVAEIRRIDPLAFGA